MRIALAFAVLLGAQAVSAQPAPVLEFQGVALESKVADLPPEKAAMCLRMNDKFRTCFVDSKISGEPAFVELGYVNDVLASIDVYFPRKLHTLVSAAYFDKFGDPWSRDQGRYWWQFNRDDLAKLRSLTVFQAATLPKTYAKDAQRIAEWSKLSFTSMAPYAAQTRQDVEKVKKDL